MKRYWLFGNSQYYAHGGMCDFQGTFDTCEKAVAFAEDALFGSNPDWWHVFDSESIVMAAGHECSYRGPEYDDERMDSIVRR